MDGGEWVEVASELEDASDKWLLDQVYGSVVNTKMCLCVCVCVCVLTSLHGGGGVDPTPTFPCC